jgi:hypothetical protein
VPSGQRKSRGSGSTSDDVGGPRGWLLLIAGWAAERNKIAVGPDLAHGSWFVRKAVLPPAV